jgi:hypothetical protein
MLEIIALIFISRHIAEIAADKGYSYGLYRFLTFLFWIGFEFFGAIAGVILFGDEDAGIYLFALVSAGLGYLILYLVVSNLPDQGEATEPISFIVNCDSLPVYEKATEYSRVIKEYKKGDYLDIDMKSDFNLFYKVQVSPDERGFVLKSSDIKKEYKS